MQIDWIDPKVMTPPFDTQILVVMGGNGSNDAARSWNKYVTVRNVIISKRSPNDDEPCDEYEALCESEDEFDQFQFYVFDYADYTYGMGEDADTDWYSDSIICWAFMKPVDQFKGESA